ncbi:hypothetical protein BD413DRAFT_181019 [Trametes elegans]|nr:hypothetical protein BD413DRAFT_181019 [Trametes elegans]
MRPYREDAQGPVKHSSRYTSSAKVSDQRAAEYSPADVLRTFHMQDPQHRDAHGAQYMIAGMPTEGVSVETSRSNDQITPKTVIYSLDYNCVDSRFLQYAAYTMIRTRTHAGNRHPMPPRVRQDY